MVKYEQKKISIKNTYRQFEQREIPIKDTYGQYKQKEEYIEIVE